MSKQIDFQLRGRRGRRSIEADQPVPGRPRRLRRPSTRQLESEDRLGEFRLRELPGRVQAQVAGQGPPGILAVAGIFGGRPREGPGHGERLQRGRQGRKEAGGSG